MEWLMLHCGAFLSHHSGGFLALALAGLVGSLTHCSTMCGPMVVAQMLAPRPEGASHKTQLATYHVGRITTYAALGAIAAFASGMLFTGETLSSVGAVALILAGVLFLTSALMPNAVKACNCDETRSSLQRLREAHLPFALKSYLRGVLLGFMPCGLVLAALLMTATLASPLAGAVGMALFGLGTMPLLQVLGLGAHRLAQGQQKWINTVGKGAMAANGAALCGMGLYGL